MIHRSVLLLLLIVIAFGFKITGNIEELNAQKSIELEKQKLSKHPTFEEFRNIYGKEYSSFVNLLYRKSIYKSNLKYIDYLNEMVNFY